MMINNEMDDSSLERAAVQKSVKVVLVGPAKCGKTALVQRFVHNTFGDVSNTIFFCELILCNLMIEIYY